MGVQRSGKLFQVLVEKKLLWQLFPRPEKCPRTVPALAECRCPEIRLLKIVQDAIRVLGHEGPCTTHAAQVFHQLSLVPQLIGV